jgi:hypothetical protein
MRATMDADPTNAINETGIRGGSMATFTRKVIQPIRSDRRADLAADDLAVPRAALPVAEEAPGLEGEARAASPMEPSHSQEARVFEVWLRAGWYDALAARIYAGSREEAEETLALLGLDGELAEVGKNELSGLRVVEKVYLTTDFENGLNG